MKYFTQSFWVSGIGLLLAGFLGWEMGGSAAAALNFMFLCAILCILEISISFDNAVVNATVLKDMTPLWQKRFLTWGILIAVFGMRLVFPLAIVSVIANVNPIEALRLAAFEPAQYAEYMIASHHQVAAFGGAFLMLVALKYFFNHEKDVHWIQFIERPLSKIGKLEAIEVGLTLLLLVIIATKLDQSEQLAFLIAGIAGILTYLAVEAIGTFLQLPTEGQQDIHRASLGMFLYLEVLDASFSFDGVVGAFAITNNLFLIMIGLGIGAMFVRSLTIYMVEKGALDTFKYLENGAFYAVGALAIIMLFGVLVHIPELVAGLVGAVFIGSSVYSSMKVVQKKF